MHQDEPHKFYQVDMWTRQRCFHQDGL